MLSPNEVAHAIYDGSAADQDLRPRAKALSVMASLSIAAGEIRAAEAYLLELLAWCAFADREEPEPALDL